MKDRARAESQGPRGLPEDEFGTAPLPQPPAAPLLRHPAAIGAALLLSAATLLALARPFPGPASAQVIAEIDNISRKGLYEERFSLTTDLDVTVEAVGSGAKGTEALLAYAWILDLRSRGVVWGMEAHRAEEAEHEDNLRQRDDVHLPAGDYVLYFSAIGGSYPIEKSIKLLQIFDLGKVSIKGGNSVRWDEIGEPREWHATVRTADGRSTAGIVTPLSREPDLGALVRFDRTPDESSRRALLEVTAPVSLRVLAIGEYSASGQGFADGAWILDCDSYERVWEMTLVNTKGACGPPKNRMFDDKIQLPAGRYWACYVTDDSHAFGMWNAQPPCDPESWGLTLIPERPKDASAVKVTLDPPEENVIVSIRQVGDSEYRAEEFRLKHAARVAIRAFGEWDKKYGRQLDFGWIEDAHTLRQVWTMDSNPGRYAAGEARNRLVEEAVSLEPGFYRVAYVTDDAHSREGWFKQPPFDPDAWGIKLVGLGKDFRMDWVELSPADDDAPTLIRLAPVGDDADRRVRFQVEGTITVKLIALGEGGDGEMFDYGWLVNEDSGRKVWEMEYRDTRHAGGGKKNRRTEAVLTLTPGTYSLHYTSDGSHSFEDWNDDPPNDAHMWGITLLEVPSEQR